MPITYDDLRRNIANDLGYKLNLSFSTEQSTRVDLLLAEGLRLFFEPPTNPRHQWRFLTIKYDLTTTADDHIVELPVRFAHLDGDLTYAPDESTVWPALRKTSDVQIMKWLQGVGSTTGRPQYYALRPRKMDQQAGTVWEMLIYPKADDVYALSGMMRLNPIIPGHDEEVVLGGQPHEQTLVQACRAAVERFNRRALGDEWQLFMQLLESSIDHDLSQYAAQTLGYNGDASDRTYGPRSTLHTNWDDHIVTHNGIDVG